MTFDDKVSIYAHAINDWLAVDFKGVQPHVGDASEFQFACVLIFLLYYPEKEALEYKVVEELWSGATRLVLRRGELVLESY